jgi:hexokinase
VVGNDVMHMFKEALVRKGVDVRPVALVNDTVGTLMAKAYSNPSCRIGVILGTGTNGAYVERASSIPKWPGSRDGFMVINMEWGGFGSGEMGRSLLPVGFFHVAFRGEGCFRASFAAQITGIDAKLDAETWNATRQRYEKMISGAFVWCLWGVDVCVCQGVTAFSDMQECTWVK